MESTHRVVARFDQAEEARDAMVDLEAQGIDADAIHMSTPNPGPPTKRAVHEADLEVVRELETKTVAGALMGAVIGAAVVILALVVLRIDSLGAATLVGGIGGAAGGAFIGAYWGAVMRLPVNEQAFDPALVGGDTAAEVTLEIRLDDPELEADAIAVLRHHHAQKIEREVA